MDPAACAAAVTAAHARHRAGASLRAGRRHAGADGHRRPPPSRHRRRLLPGAPGDLRRRAGRHASASAARSASTRRRILARSATAARRSPTIAAVAERVKRLRNGGQTSRYRARRGRHQQPARRNAGGGPPRAAAAARTNGRAAAASWPRQYRRSLPAPVSADRGARSRSRVSPVPRARAGRDALQAAMTAAGIETLIHYPVPLNEQPAFARVSRARVSGRRTRHARAAVAAAPPRPAGR